ncbi:MAG TPA: NUMOD1 domain-containing DNA-binding protein [Aequorivita sp.]|nr:NUMOD1 domain-containing DNA-binding protein [Aequorivita sp.]
MMKKNKSTVGIIYTVKNKVTCKYYVGATTDSVENRKKDHLQKASKGTGHPFQEAIATYGAEAFEWKQVDSASTTDELARMEKEYIIKYNSQNDGYNSDRGGSLKKTVYQYNIEDGTLNNTYESLDCAASAVNADKKSISRACLNVNHLYKGYYWNYDLTIPIVVKGDKRQKEVIQLDSNGNVLAKYVSVAEASNTSGVNKSCIAKCCRGERKSAGGFYWKFI